MSEKVLIVDDDPASRWLICQFLERLRLQFDCAANGREALEPLYQRPYTVVLMDINMPELDGYDTTRAIRSRERESLARFIPVIAITAAPDAQRCLDAGITAYL